MGTVKKKVKLAAILLKARDLQHINKFQSFF